MALVIVGIFAVTMTANAATMTLTVVGGADMSLSHWVKQAATDGSYVYLAMKASGTNSFKIVDVRTPATPTVVGGSGINTGAGEGYSVAVSGNYVYLGVNAAVGGVGSSMRIINVSNKENPAVVDGGYVDFIGSGEGPPSHMAIAGNMLYALQPNGDTNDHKFFSINVATPGSPSIVNPGGLLLYTSNLDVSGLIVDGNYAYITMNQESSGTSGLRIVDISNPASPSVVGGTALTMLAAPNGVAKSGNYLFVAHVDGVTATNRLRIIDVTNPAAPSIVGGSNISVSALGAFSPVIVGSYLYLGAIDGSGGMIVEAYDISSPLNPTVAASDLSVSSGDTNSGLNAKMVGSGNYLYQFANANNGMRVIHTAIASTGGGYTDFIPPDPPTKLTAESDGKTVKLVWKDPQAADVSQIQILRNSGGGTPIDGGNIYGVAPRMAQIFIDSNVTSGATYQYQIRVKDTAGNQSLSDVLTVSVQPSSPPAEQQPPAPGAPKEVAPKEQISNPRVDNSNLLTNVPEEYFTCSQNNTIVRSPFTLAKQDFYERGTFATMAYGPGERKVAWREFVELYCREPAIAEVDLMVTGQVHEREAAFETRRQKLVLPLWQKITKRKSLNNSSAYDEQVYLTIMYRLRFPRELHREQQGIKQFTNIFKRFPKSSEDWAAVRALGYLRVR